MRVPQILRWADGHHRRTGRWPKEREGPITEAPGETWMAVDMALRKGHRGLPGGSSLIRLLAEHRSVRNPAAPLRLSPAIILKWADDHHTRTGKWPKQRDGPILAAPGETWMAVEAALATGQRGLAIGSSLPRLLAEHRGVRNIRALPPLSSDLILKWVDTHRDRTGQWPTKQSGPISEAPGETWMAVDSALWGGRRGLSGSLTLARFLKKHRRD